MIILNIKKHQLRHALENKYNATSFDVRFDRNEPDRQFGQTWIMEYMSTGVVPVSTPHGDMYYIDPGTTYRRSAQWSPEQIETINTTNRTTLSGAVAVNTVSASGSSLTGRTAWSIDDFSLEGDMNE